MTVLILAACSSSSARPPAVLAPDAPAVIATPSTGRLSGTVTEVTSDAPIAGVEIIVHAAVLDVPRLARTDDAGHYEIGDLPVGTFTVSTRLSGFVQTGFAFRHSQGTQGTIPLGVDEHRSRVDVRLTKEASIAGRIVDDAGAPVADAVVTVLRPRLDDGQRLLATFGSARTDANGRYRIAGLLRGDYYVTAFEADPTVTTAVVATHSPTYYAGSADAAGATRVNVLRAAHVTGIDFVVRRVPWSRILGSVRRARDGTIRSGAIILQPNDAERLVPAPQQTATWLPNDRFAFEQVPPGDYIIRVMGESRAGSAMLFAEHPVTVTGRDVVGVVLTLYRGATLSGTSRFMSRGSPAPGVGQWRIFAPLEDGSRFGGEPKGTIGSNGRFHVSGVDAGQRLIRVIGVPAPWSLDRVLRNGIDITDTPIDVTPGEALTHFELVFTDSAPSVTGLVRTCTGEPVVDALVVAFPFDRLHWRPTSRHIHSTRTDWQGHYTLLTLPPGPYLMAVVTDFEEADIFERETLDQLSRQSISIALSTGQTHRQDLTGDRAGGPCPPVPF